MALTWKVNLKKKSDFEDDPKCKNGGKQRNERN